MSIHDREDMRTPRERPGWPPPREPLSPLWWILMVLLVLLALGRWAHDRWPSLRASWAATPRSEAVAPSPVAAPPYPNPFPDDPTWHTGARPAIEHPAPVRAPGEDAGYKSRRGGSVSYGDAAADCADGKGAWISVDPGPAPEPTARPVRRVAEAAPATRAQPPAVVVAAPPPVDTRRFECQALEHEIASIDAAARLPQGPQVQDALRARREKARSRQFALHC
jgi:hypothetical protein